MWRRIQRKTRVTRQGQGINPVAGPWRLSTSIILRFKQYGDIGVRYCHVVTVQPFLILVHRLSLPAYASWCIFCEFFQAVASLLLMFCYVCFKMEYQCCKYQSSDFAYTVYRLRFKVFNSQVVGSWDFSISCPADIKNICNERCRMAGLSTLLPRQQELTGWRVVAVLGWSSSNRNAACNVFVAWQLFTWRHVLSLVQ
jgi:hypothetical protein